MMINDSYNVVLLREPKMFDYKTATEKAKEWVMPARKIQELCRKGTISGAKKYGGVWFIPAQAENPLKQGNELIALRGTKKKILEKAIELFSQQTFELVTVKQIADEVGIAPSAVYNHFGSKQDVLDAIYELCKVYHTMDRPDLEGIEPLMEDGSLMDFMNFMDYHYAPEHKEFMLQCVKIVFQRAFFDEKARTLFRYLVFDGGFAFAKEVLEKANETGRFLPFDPEMLASYRLMCRGYLLMSILIDVQKENEVLEKHIHDVDMLLAERLDIKEENRNGY